MSQSQPRTDLDLERAMETATDPTADALPQPEDEWKYNDHQHVDSLRSSQRTYTVRVTRVVGTEVTMKVVRTNNHQNAPSPGTTLTRNRNRMLNTDNWTQL